MRIFCLIAVRDEERYLPGFLKHMAPHVTGIIALDDCSGDQTLRILENDPGVVSVLKEKERGLPHANETRNRHRLLMEAARLNADWVICADADERFEEAFLERLFEEALQGENTKQYIRYVQLVNLWNSPFHYRSDGLCGPRWAPRMFKVPAKFTKPVLDSMHRPWYPPELNTAARVCMEGVLYHLRMIRREDREKRFEKFSLVDPSNSHQSIGYGHIIDESGLKRISVVESRYYKNFSEEGIFTRFFDPYANDKLANSLLPAETEFDELFYLNQHQDVRSAVMGGLVSNGWQHFLSYGTVEKRVWRKKARFIGLDFKAIFKQNDG